MVETRFAPRQILLAVVAVVAVATAVGVVVLWPRGEAPQLGPTAADLDYVHATVTDVEGIDCIDSLEQLEVTCQLVHVDVTSGVPAGESGTFLKSLIDRSTPEFTVGDRVILSYNPLAPVDFRYVFFEFQRGAPLAALAVAFVAVVVAFGRWKGVRALAGLAVSFLVIGGFLLPSLLRDNHAVAAALVAGSLIAFAALYLAHGVTIATTVALVGTLSSVALITALAAVVTGVAHLSGLADESLQILTVTAEAIDPRGILVAGIAIGALGVLDDVTVTQVSAVSELRRANPSMSNRQLYSSAIRIGRDHIASTVNTLVLAYVGASLAMMLFFFQEGRSFAQMIGREVVAIAVVRMLVGSIGLILSVPATTALAVLVADDDGLGPVHGHTHHHGPPTDVDDSHPPAPSWDDFAPRS